MRTTGYDGDARLNQDLITELYRKFAPDLMRARDEQRRRYAIRGDTRLERYAPYRALRALLGAVGLPAHWKRLLKPQFDDIEAEVTYLLLRELAPRTVVEIAPDRGWSTTWILVALRDNGSGRLFSYDIADHSTRAVPRALADQRWTFTLGDITQHLDRLPPQIDYLFLDCAHSAEFARWYIRELFPRLAPGTPVGIHDIFPDAARFDRFGEAGVVQQWLEERRVTYFTAAPAKAPAVYEALLAVKGELGMADPIHRSRANPMVFFRT
jgi:predicted O-methyltransferase YrrM